MDLNELENKINLIINTQDPNKEIENIYETKTILGFDIYKYSKFDLAAQTLIPIILHKIIFTFVISDLQQYESIFFRNYTVNDFEKNYINTGDGGFFIFETPFHGLLFSIYLSARLKIYNTGKLLPNEYKITKEISYRFAMTLGKIFSFKNNWFGPSIITCSRIISTDKLNRFLIDNNVKEWFEENINGIETLLSLGQNNLRNNNKFKEYFDNFKDENGSLIIPPKGNDPGLINSNIINMNLSKIELIENKNDKISAYNLYLQIYIITMNINNLNSPDKFVISIGNLNATGL